MTHTDLHGGGASACSGFGLSGIANYLRRLADLSSDMADAAPH